LASTFAVGVVLGSPPKRHESATAISADTTSAPAERAVVQVPAPRPSIAVTPTTAASATRNDQAAHGRRLLQSLYDHTNRLKAAAPPGTAPEAIANQAVSFLVGWVDGLRFTSAEALDAVGAAVREKVCGGGQSTEESLVSAYVLQWMPEIAAGATFDCFFQDPRRTGVEDVETWAMLDAWRNSGLEPPAAVAALKASAQDPRTVRRFLPREQSHRPGLAQAGAPAASTDPRAR
jgi:hypothetical protein